MRLTLNTKFFVACSCLDVFDSSLCDDVACLMFIVMAPEPEPELAPLDSGSGNKTKSV